VSSKWGFGGLRLLASSWVPVWSMILESKLICRKRWMLLKWINLNLGRLYAMMSSMIERSLVCRYGELSGWVRRICPLMWCRNSWSWSIQGVVLHRTGRVSSKTGHIIPTYSWYCSSKISNVWPAVSLILRCLINCMLCWTLAS